MFEVRSLLYHLALCLLSQHIGRQHQIVYETGQSGGNTYSFKHEPPIFSSSNPNSKASKAFSCVDRNHHQHQLILKFQDSNLNLVLHSKYSLAPATTQSLSEAMLTWIVLLCYSTVGIVAQATSSSYSLAQSVSNAPAAATTPAAPIAPAASTMTTVTTPVQASATSTTQPLKGGIDNLTLTTYSGPDCHSSAPNNWTTANTNYQAYAPAFIESYKLSRALYSTELLAFYYLDEWQIGDKEVSREYRVEQTTLGPSAIVAHGCYNITVAPLLATMSPSPLRNIGAFANTNIQVF
ncbi:hypothetical protein MMC21_007086 [Puttea exsequens]|nr:hypothetical protein [Puttea exsequens]